MWGRVEGQEGEEEGERRRKKEWEEGENEEEEEEEEEEEGEDIAQEMPSSFWKITYWKIYAYNVTYKLCNCNQMLYTNQFVPHQNP